jgi:hypothetical protein
MLVLDSRRLCECVCVCVCVFFPAKENRIVYRSESGLVRCPFDPNLGLSICVYLTVLTLTSPMQIASHNPHHFSPTGSARMQLPCNSLRLDWEPQPDYSVYESSMNLIPQLLSRGDRALLPPEPRLQISRSFVQPWISLIRQATPRLLLRELAMESISNIISFVDRGSTPQGQLKPCNEVF